MKYTKQFLAMLLVTTLLTGSLYLPAAASQTDQVSGAEIVLEDEEGETEDVSALQGNEAEEGDNTGDETAAPEDEDTGTDQDGSNVSDDGPAQGVFEDQEPEEDQDAEKNQAEDNDLISEDDEITEDDQNNAVMDDEGATEDAAPQEDDSLMPAADSEEESGTDPVPAVETDPSAEGSDQDSAATADTGALSGKEDGAEITGGQGEEETASENAAGGALSWTNQSGENVTVDTLDTDLTIEGDAFINGDFLDLNGHTLTVTGDLIQPGGVLLVNGGKLIVNGDYRIQRQNVQTDPETGQPVVSYSGGSGVLAMHDDKDTVTVSGGFYISGNNYYDDKNNVRINEALTAGTLEIGTGLYQTLDHYSSFRASGTHRVLIKGDGARTISFANDGCRIAALETEGTPDIGWEGFFNVGKLGSDVSIHTVNEDGITIWSPQDRITDFYGHNLTVTGNVRAIRGKLYIGGASLQAEAQEAGGAERPESMGSLTIDGNVIQAEDLVVVDGGTFTVTGDYRIQRKNIREDAETGQPVVSYGEGSGVLAMHDDHDKVIVGGGFYISGNNYYDDKNNVRINETLTAGTLEIGTGLYQTLDHYSSFRASGTHRVLIKGDGARTISFANAGCRIAALETEGTPDIGWEGFFNVGKLGSDVSIHTVDEDGITIWSPQDRITDFYGHNLTVTGNVRAIRGKLYIGGATIRAEAQEAGGDERPEKAGSLTVDGNVTQAEDVVVVDGGTFTVTGDYRIQRKKIREDAETGQPVVSYGEGSGTLAMNDDDDKVIVGGSFYISGNNYYDDKNNKRISETLTAGTLEIGKSFYQTLDHYSSFRATGTHRTILKGTGPRVVQFANSDERSRFQILEISQDPSNYIFNRIPCWDTLLYNGENITESAFSYTASVDNTNKTLTITRWNDNAAEIVIPEKLNDYTVTGIGKELFKNRTDLTKITLPDTVVYIGRSAFSGCSSLVDLALPASLSEIEEYAFYECIALTQIMIPAPVVSIGSQAFYGCTSLAAVTFAEGSSLESIGNSAFQNNRALTAVSLPEGTKTLGQAVFYECNALKSVNMPASVTGMGDEVFYHTALETAGPAGSGEVYDYTFGWTEEIPANAFRYIQTLTAVTLPGTVKQIREYAFYNCSSLPGILLPANLEGLGRYAFASCGALTSIILPDTLEEMGNDAFNSCENLEQAQIGEGSRLTAIPGNAFHNCKKLGGINLPEGVTDIGNGAFHGCEVMTQLQIPAAVTRIGNNAFRYCKALETAVFEDGSGLTEIGIAAFENDTALTGMTIPEGTRTLRDGVFRNCTAFVKVTMPATVSAMGSEVFKNTALTSAGPAGSGADYEFGWRENIPAYAFDGIDTLTALILPDTIRSLGRNAVAECRNLTTIKLPDSLKSMGEEVFSGCEKLQKIEIPEGVVVLPQRAFYRCLSLTEAELPTTLKEIQGWAFQECESLEEVNVPEGVSLLPERCFIGCKSLAEVTLPDSITEIQGWAFENCISLTVLDIPDGVTAIKSLVFKNTPALIRLIVPESVTSLNEDAILETNSTGLVMYVMPGSASEQYAISHNIPYENMNTMGHTLSMQVKDPAGEPVTGGFTVYWYDQETGQLLGQGARLRGVKPGTRVLCTVVLGGELGRQYVQPDDFLYEMGADDHVIELSLASLGTATISGTVKDAGGAAIPGASIVLEQTYNGSFETTMQTSADENGAFTFNAYKARSVLTFSADGCYDKTYTVAENSFRDGTAALDAVLEKLPADKITLTLLRSEAVLPGETGKITQITGTASLEFAVYNETTQQVVTDTDFRVQYPYMMLGAGAASGGDKLRLSLTDREGTMTARDVTVVLDENRCGSVEWTLVQNGSIQLTGVTSEAVSADGEAAGTAVMVFDGQGKSVESGSFGSSYTTKSLPEGSYTCVLMEKTSLLRGLDSHEKLAELNLTAGTDYTEVSAEVQNGVITVRDGITVPDFDETKLYYTVKGGTQFWANCGTATTARYVTMRASYEIDQKYQTDSQTLSFEIPAGLQFEGSSLTVDGRAAAYSKTDKADGGTNVTVVVGRPKGTVRFYVLPTSSGSKKTYAYLSFNKGSDSVMQPLGSVLIDVKAATITVPARTGFKNVAASGKTAKNSDITVFDNGKKVGTTRSNGNGSWSLAFDLVRPLNYSYHKIYAHVDSPDYGEIETETAGILYNANYVQLSKVTMINTAHPDNSLHPSEFRTVFDFLQPEKVIPTYNYWPSYPTFTFLVEFTGGDADSVSNVKVFTKNSSGDRTVIVCSYDEKSGKWIGTHDYNDFSDVPCYVGVTCTNSSGDVISEGMDAEDLTDILTDAGRVDNTLEAMAEKVANIHDETVLADRVSFDVSLGSEKYGEYSIVLLDYNDFDLEAWKKDRYVEYRDQDGTVSYEASYIQGDTCTTYTAYPADRIYVKETLKLKPDDSASGTAAQGRGFMPPLADSMVFDPARNSLSLDWVTDTVYAGYKSNGQVMKFVKDITGFQDVIDFRENFLAIDANGRTLLYDLGEYKNAIIRKKCKCITKEMKDGYWKDAEDIEKQIEEYVRRAKLLTGGVLAANAVMNFCGGKVLKLGGKLTKAGGKWIYKAVRNKYGSMVRRDVRRAAFHGVNIIAEETGGYIENKMGDLTKYLTNLFDLKDVIQSGFTSIRDYIRASVKALNLYKCPCEKGGGKCKCDPESPGLDDEEEPDEHGGGPDGNASGYRSVVPKADPSGYVYEAVPSNRIEGVTATIYQYTFRVDELGVEHKDEPKEETLWKAEDFDQVNPQVTDVYGTFGWDVPAGDWLVRFHKDGYEDADSYGDVAATSVGDNGKHYLPVPPIQTEVNTAMVSQAAPAVSSVSAYPEEVQIDFSQYMQIDSVNTANVTVKASGGGENIAGTILPLNEEENYDKTASYASSFAFRPDKAAGELSGNVTVSVKAGESGVKNYHGTAMAADYSADHAIVLMPRELVITGADEIIHNESGEITIQVLPEQAGANRTLTVTSWSPSILSAREQTATTDQSGKATVIMEGNLPGQGIFTVSLDDTKLEEERQIAVLAVSRVKSLEDGTYSLVLNKNSFTYNGQDQKPEVSVEGKDGEKLEEGRDYKLTFSEDVKNAGTKTVTVTGMRTVSGAGDYEGTLTADYKILKASQAVTGPEASYKKTFGDGAFSLNAKAATGLIYKSSDEKIVQVSNSGTVTIKGAGSANITITAAADANHEAASKTAAITVAKASQTVTGPEASYKKTFGDGAFSLNAKAATGLTYKSSDEKIVQVSTTGTVTIKGAGSANITITAVADANREAASKTVSIIVAKASQTVTGPEASYKKTYGGGAFSLNAKAATGLTYKSSDEKIVQVSSSGTVTIKGAGTAKVTITAAADANREAASKTVTITVAKASQTIKGLKTTYKKTYGAKAFYLKASAATALKYKSSNAKVAAVNAAGKVAIKGAGTAKITVTASADKNYKAASKTVTVSVAKAKPTIKVKTSTKTYKAAVVKKKAQTFSPGITVNSKGTLSYKKTSGNKKITVNKKNGKITVAKGMKKGTYKIGITVTAAAKGNYTKGTKKVTVTVRVK